MAPAAFISGALVAFLVTALITPILARIAEEKQCVDAPDGERKRHERVVPTLGGIAIGIGFFGGWLYLFGIGQQLGLTVDVPHILFWAGAVLMIATGIYDDTRGLGFKTKFVLQVLAAYGLLHAGYRLDIPQFEFIAGDPYREALFSIPLTMLWVVGIINAVNLMDGLDGLAAGVVNIAFISLSAIFWMEGEIAALVVGVTMIGALFGFLLHNFKPAIIFMGDSGSLFIGYMVAAFSLSAPVHSDPVMALLIVVVALGVPVIDTSVTIMRRFIEGQAIFYPDHDHIHHRLISVLPEREAVLVLYGAASWFGVGAFLMALVPTAWGYAMLALTLITMIAGLRYLNYLRVRGIYRGLKYRYLLSRRPEESKMTTQPVRSGPVQFGTARSKELGTNGSGDGQPRDAREQPHEDPPQHDGASRSSQGGDDERRHERLPHVTFLSAENSES